MTDETTAARAALRRHGEGVRAEVLGADYAATSIANHSDFAMNLLDFSITSGWGMVWDRPGLTRQERCLITLAAMAATGHQGEVRVHVRSSLAAGITTTQIRELIVQLAPYCGIATAAETMRTVEATFADLGVQPDAD